MNILFQLGHPAHFYMYRHTIENLKRDGHKVFIVIRSKDILEELIEKSGFPHKNIMTNKKKGKINYCLRLIRAYKTALKFHADIVIGSTPEVAIIGRLLRRRSVIMVEDDYCIIPQFDNIARPFADQVLSPITCNNGPLEPNTTHYAGFQKLAYLHPNYFTPNPSIVDQYFPHDETYFLLRFAKLEAFHDINVHARGISNEVATKLIEQLSPHGRVYISSERSLPESLEPYRLSINPLDIHHIMAYASLYVGDSQSMAVEAAMLGTPSIRFNDFAGRIGVLEELEQTYQLTIGIPADKPDELYEHIERLLSTSNLRDTYQQRRQKMLSEKIDVTAFFTQFIENL